MKAIIIIIVMLVVLVLEALLATLLHDSGGISILFGLCDALLVFYLIEKIEIN